jgi:hypothetical protein
MMNVSSVIRSNFVFRLSVRLKHFVLVQHIFGFYLIQPRHNAVGIEIFHIHFFSGSFNFTAPKHSYDLIYIGLKTTKVRTQIVC